MQCIFSPKIKSSILDFKSYSTQEFLRKPYKKWIIVPYAQKQDKIDHVNADYFNCQLVFRKRTIALN